MSGQFWTGWAIGFGGAVIGPFINLAVEILRDHFRLRAMRRMAEEHMIREAERYANRGDDS